MDNVRDRNINLKYGQTVNLINKKGDIIYRVMLREVEGEDELIIDEVGDIHTAYNTRHLAVRLMT